MLVIRHIRQGYLQKKIRSVSPGLEKQNYIFILRTEDEIAILIIAPRGLRGGRWEAGSELARLVSAGVGRRRNTHRSRRYGPWAKGNCRLPRNCCCRQRKRQRPKASFRAWWTRKRDREFPANRWNVPGSRCLARTFRNEIRKLAWRNYSWDT